MVISPARLDSPQGFEGWGACRMLRLLINHTCLLLLVSTISYVGYSSLHSRDPYHCAAILNDGKWIRPPNEWQPPGCMMRNYQAVDLTDCGLRKLTFIGDSLMRQSFWATAEKLDTLLTQQAVHDAERHSNITVSIAGIRLDFVWDPYLNTSALQHHLRAQQSDADEASSMVILGGGLWHARYLGEDYLQDFGEAMDAIAPFVNPRWPEERKFTKIQQLRDVPNYGNLPILAPVHIPYYMALSPDRAATLTQDRINSMNDYLHRLCKNHGAKVAWSWLEMIWQQSLAYQRDGLHVASGVAARQMDVVLNMRCNSKLSRLGNRYPLDNTCCNSYRRLSWLQRVVLMVSFTVLPMVACFPAEGMSDDNLLREGGDEADPQVTGSRRPALLPSRKVCHALAVVGAVVSFCYLTDRTHIFSKAHKQHSLNTFITMSLTVVILGILSIRHSTTPLRGTGPNLTIRNTDQPILSRDQTDEWKGWMQFLILIYHYTGTSKVLGIYKVIRILVASYLFMTGFGHTAFFYRKNDYSLRRLAAILIRINLLSCVLPYMMKTDYLFYYFAPLTSLWYLIVYLTMRLGQKRNKSPSFLVGKILISALLTTGAVRTPGIIEVIFGCLKKLAKIRWDVKEWRFRMGLDLYIVYIGMLSAIAYVKVLESKDLKVFLSSTRIRVLLVIAACTTLGILWIALGSITEKAEYNSWVPYISWLPILSFVILRNCSRHLRNYHSSIFALLGRYSLETFTLQFHIWLAADTKGVLILGFSRWVDFIALTIMFLWISWHVGHATNDIVLWIVEPSRGQQHGNLECSRSDMNLPRIRSINIQPVTYRQGLKAYVLRNELKVRLGVLLILMCVLNLAS